MKAKTDLTQPPAKGSGCYPAKGSSPAGLELHALSDAEICVIDQAVQEVGEFGEVRLIISKGHIRFIGKFKTESMPEY